MANKWDNVNKNDILKAIKKYDFENMSAYSRNTFLNFNSKLYPAKHIRGLAYEIAFGYPIKKSEYSGGKETLRFFEKRGFKVKYTGGSSRSSIKNTDKKNKSITKSISNKGVVKQKNALQLYLNRIFDGDLVSEKTFTWMKTPKSYEENLTYKKITNALKSYRGNENIGRNDYKLRCDFVCESHKVIIEYDERQHFSEARRQTLINYPEELDLNFNKESWIESCLKICAVDNHPYNRDEIRAYYDSVRDIEAAKHGFKLIRIRHGDFNWYEEAGKKWLENKLSIERPPKNTSSKRSVLQEYDWRSLEIELQRIRLQYLKWLYYYKPQDCDALEALKEESKIYVIDSPYGRSFSLSLAGSKSVYIGGGRGVVKLAKDSYRDNKKLTHETESIKKSLDRKVKALKSIIKKLIKSKNYSAVWEYIQNFWWLRLGMHEYVYDVQFKKYPLPSTGVRYYVLVAIYNRVDLSVDLPECFSDKQILRSLSYKFSWRRFGMCSYDCGPIAVGKKGFVPYRKVAKSICDYFMNNQDRLDKLDKLENINGKRDFAISSLDNLYDFLLPYHKEPLGFLYYQDFVIKKDRLREEINKIEQILNYIAKSENLDLS